MEFGCRSFSIHADASILANDISGINSCRNSGLFPAISQCTIQMMYQEYRQFIGTILTKVDARLGEPEAALVLAVIDGAFLQCYLEPALEFKALLLLAIQWLPRAG